MSHFNGMQTFSGLPQDLSPWQQGVITLGNFDGLHLGHRSLIQLAQKFPHPHLVFTFDPHPLKVLRPEKLIKPLFPRADLMEQLKALKVDAAVVFEFNHYFSQQTAEQFLDQCVRPFRPSHLVVGYDFAFGKDRSGNLDILKGWAKTQNVEIHVCQPNLHDGQPISSRRIRDMVASGKVEIASALLGRSFYLRGSVMSGAQRGRKLGFPTLNMRPENEIIPAPGVYISNVVSENHKLPSITNIGVNPTFEKTPEAPTKIETHVLVDYDFAKLQVYDLELLRLLRPEKTFSSAEDLQNQISRDILEAKEYFGIKR